MWQPIETAPRGRTVLVYYKNVLGNGRTVKACLYERFTVESCQDNAEYCEEMDEYYCPEGWYEQIDNWDDFTSVFICQGNPTHWMPLPEPPND